MRARRPAGRFAIHGGAVPSGGGGWLNTRRELQSHEPRHELVGRQRLERSEALPERLLLRRSLVPGPGRFEQRQAEEPLAVLSGEGERGGAAARVADEMETLEAARSASRRIPSTSVSRL